jgi:hypothetical protein
MLVSPLFYMKVLGIGPLLDQMIWWLFKLDFRMLKLEKRMLLFGSPRVVFTLVEKLGISLDLSSLWSLGGRLYGIPWLFPGMLSYCGWFSDRPLRLRRKCVARDLWGIPYVGSVFMCKNQLIIFFFQCGFSRRIWRNLMADCLSPSPIVSWDDIVLWACSLKGKGPHTTLCKLGLAAAVYHIWRLRNELCFGNSPLIEEALVARIKWDVRTKVLTRKFKRSPLDRKLSALWML